MFGAETIDEPRLRDLLDREAARRASEAAELRLLAELENDQLCDRRFGMGTGSWLAARTGLPVGQCRHRVWLACRLVRHFPGLLAALEAGRVGWEHAKVILNAANPRIVEQFAELEDAMIDAAEGRTFRLWAMQVKHAAELLDLEGGYDPTRDDPGKAHLGGSGEHLLLSAIGHGADAVTFREAVDLFTEEAFRRATADGEQSSDLAMPTRAQLRWRGLVEMARRALAQPLTDSRPAKPEVTLIVNAQDGTATTEQGDRVRQETLWLLAPEARWRTLRVDDRGNPLDLGRARRLADTRLRVALIVRDGLCTFPGCDRPAEWCDLHHVWPWEEGGPTDQANLALLCRHHHGVTHRRGWTMTPEVDEEGEATEWFTWTTPSGDTLLSQRHGRQRRPHQREPRAA